MIMRMVLRFGMPCHVLAVCCGSPRRAPNSRRPASRGRASKNLRSCGKANRHGARKRGAGGDVPDDRVLRRAPANLPLEFFARVIWQESRFRPDAVGPMTRRGQRAQGIAQFMPGTANERGLLDPFNPVQALPKSAEFLAELRDAVRQSRPCGCRLQRRSPPGAGMARRTGGMPSETRNYVSAITGASVEDWAKAARAASSRSACRHRAAAS